MNLSRGFPKQIQIPCLQGMTKTQLLAPSVPSTSIKTSETKRPSLLLNQQLPKEFQSKPPKNPTAEPNPQVNTMV